MTNPLGETMPLFGGGPSRRGPVGKEDLRREQERLNAARDERTRVAIEQAKAEDERRAARRAEWEREHRARKEAEVAKARAAIERELLDQGCPPREAPRLAAEAVTRRFAAVAERAASGRGGRGDELRDYFRRQGAGAYAPPEPTAG